MKHISIADRSSPIIDVIRSSMPFLDLEDGPWVAGGCGRLIFEDAQSLNRSDIDVFCKNEDQMRWATGMIERHARSGFICRPAAFNSSHAAPTMVLTRRDFEQMADIDTTPFGTNEPVEEVFTLQIIKKIFRPTFEELLDSFDFEASMFVTDGYTLIAREDAIIGDRILKWGKHNKLSHIGRLVKYCDKGFYPAPGVLSAIMKVNTEEFLVNENLSEVVESSGAASKPEY